MKKMLLAILLLNTITTMAQSDEVVSQVSHYLFPNFTQGSVYFKGGGVNTTMLNYNALTTEMVFQNNGSILAIANPENVDSVVIQNRKFIYVDNKFYEQLTTTPHPLFREYVCYIEQPGVSTGYGTTSTTTAATYIRGIYGPTVAYQTKLPEDLKIAARQIWWIKTDKGFQKFLTEQQFKKIFSDKKDQVSAYLKQNNVHFPKQDEVTALVRAIDQ